MVHGQSMRSLGEEEEGEVVVVVVVVVETDRCTSFLETEP